MSTSPIQVPLPSRADIPSRPAPPRQRPEANRPAFRMAQADTDDRPAKPSAAPKTMKAEARTDAAPRAEAAKADPTRPGGDTQAVQAPALGQAPAQASGSPAPTPAQPEAVAVSEAALAAAGTLAAAAAGATEDGDDETAEPEASEASAEPVAALIAAPAPLAPPATAAASPSGAAATGISAAANPAGGAASGPLKAAAGGAAGAGHDGREAEATAPDPGAGREGQSPIARHGVMADLGAAIPASLPGVPPVAPRAADALPVPALPAPALTHPVSSDVTVGGVPIEIGLRSLEGVNRFDIRLTPERLGEVAVALDIGEGGDVKAHLVVERPETLALLRREMPQLERALEQAGFRPQEGGLALSLRDPSADPNASGQNPRFDDRTRQHRTADRPEGETQTPLAAAITAGHWARLGGLDLRI